jgi:microcystin-dependent protein
MRELGVAVAVFERDLGSTLAQDASAAATTLYLNDVSYFSPNGGSLYITDGTNEETLVTYAGINEDDQTLTGVDGLVNAYDADDTLVAVYPLLTVRYAEVVLDGQVDTVRARVPFSMFDRLQVAFRDPSADETQRVEVELQDSEYVVVDVLGEAPSLDVNTLTVVEDLSVEGTLTLEGDEGGAMVVERGASVTLDGQQGAPQLAPSVSQSWDSFSLDEVAALDNGAEITALYYDPTLTHFFVCVEAASVGGGDTGYILEYDNTWTYVQTIEIADLVAGPYGMARAGGKFYVLAFTGEPGTPLRFIRYSTTWTYEAVHSASDWNGVTTPRINGDGTDIHWNDTNLTPISGNMKQVFRRYTSAGAAPSLASTTTTDDIYSQPRGFVGRGSFDLGATRWVAAPLSEAYVRTWTTAGVEQANEKFRFNGATDGFTCVAACWDGTRFWSIPEAEHTVYKHSTITYTTESTTWWVGYSWYDSDATGGTHETNIGPKRSFTMARRKKVTWTTAAPPDEGGTDDPSAVRVYLGRGSTEPAASAMYRQTTGSDGQTTGDWDSATFSGTTAPSNDFPGGSDAASIIPGVVSTTFAPLKGTGDGFLPIGGMMMWGTATAPTGWLKCDGSAVSRTTYANLFAVIGTTFGSGDGSTTFNLPNLSGRFPLGVGTASNPALAGTGSGGTHGTAGNHNHDGHAAAIADHNQAVNTTTGGGGTRTTTANHSGSHAGEGGHTHDAHTYANGALPPYLGVYFIIKY